MQQQRCEEVTEFESIRNREPSRLRKVWEGYVLEIQKIKRHTHTHTHALPQEKQRERERGIAGNTGNPGFFLKLLTGFLAVSVSVSVSVCVCVCVCVSWRTQMQKAIPWPPLHLPSKTSIYFATPSSLAILLSRNPASTMEPLVSSPFSIAYHQVSLSKSMHFRVFEKMWIVYAA